jgi:CTP synthase
MPDQTDVTDKGGTMRLGLYPARLEEGSKVRAAYDSEIAYERHRHRFEVNNAYRDRLNEAGMWFSGISPDGRLVEYIELRDHPWFVATQAHPELKSRPNRPHPLFRDFVGAAATLAGLHTEPASGDAAVTRPPAAPGVEELADPQRAAAESS